MVKNKRHFSFNSFCTNPLQSVSTGRDGRRTQVDDELLVLLLLYKEIQKEQAIAQQSIIGSSCNKRCLQYVVCMA